jgi:hypothetical protein
VSINDNVSHTIYILIHTISVERRPTMRVNIYNQCPGFRRLRNPKYFINGAYWNEYPDQGVDAGSMMSVDLLPFLSTFEGILIYDLGCIKSPNTRFLVTWKSEGYRKFCVFVYLVKYDDWCFWNKIKTEEYYQRYTSRLNTYTGPIEETWLLDDDTVLMTGLELDFTQRDGVLNIVISEGVEDKNTKRLEWIDIKK